MSAKRGRPPLMSKTEEATVKWIKSDTVSRRSTANGHYMLKAMATLKTADPELYALFMHRDNIMAGDKRHESSITKSGRVPHTILYELGRFDDPAAMVEAARWVADKRPSTRVAVKALRAWRLDRMPEATVEGLADALVAAFNGYIHGHGRMDRDAVDIAMILFRESIDGWISETFSDNQEGD